MKFPKIVLLWLSLTLSSLSAFGMGGKLPQPEGAQQYPAYLCMAVGTDREPDYPGHPLRQFNSDRYYTDCNVSAVNALSFCKRNDSNPKTCRLAYCARMKCNGIAGEKCGDDWYQEVKSCPN